MSTADSLTAEQFAEQKLDLPEGGRWLELVAGRIVELEPPDVAHGTTVLNFSKAIARALRQSADDNVGYACFDVGIVVARGPDTVRFPAISYFGEGERFAETDRAVAVTMPSLVVEIVSSNSRRRELSRRIEEYHAAGVSSVWVADPVEQLVYVAQRYQQLKKVGSDEMLEGGRTLAGFRIRVTELFAEPSWWR